MDKQDGGDMRRPSSFARWGYGVTGRAPIRNEELRRADIPLRSWRALREAFPVIAKKERHGHKDEENSGLTDHACHRLHQVVPTLTIRSLCLGQGLE